MARAWAVGFALAAVGVVAAVAIFVGALYGDAGLHVAAVEVSGSTPTNASANCGDVVIRQVAATVTVEREGVGFANPQVWAVGVSVRASAFGTTETRRFTLSPGESRTLTIPISHVREGSFAPRQHVEVDVRVSHGNTRAADRTLSTTLVPVERGESC